MLNQIAGAFEIAGSLILVVGLVLATVLAVRVLVLSRDGRAAYRLFREAFGGTILLGLEVLVAADLVRTVAVEQTLASVAALGLVVLIRTFLSFSLEIEIDGIPPWKKALVSGAAVTANAVRRGLAAPAAGPSGAPSSESAAPATNITTSGSATTAASATASTRADRLPPSDPAG